MDQNFQTSFIPKRPLAEDRVERPTTVSVYLLIATILLIASIVAAGIMFAYKSSLTTQVAQMQDSLQKAGGAFQPDFIQELQTEDKRINAANEVLANHVVVSPIFQALGQGTLKSIQFTKFGYTITGSGPTAQVNVSMSGKSQSYTAIALESSQLGANKYIKNPIFSNLAPDTQGDVLFDLSFSVDPQFVSYEQSLARSGAPTANSSDSGAQAPTSQQPSSTSNGAGVVSFPGASQ